MLKYNGTILKVNNGASVIGSVTFSPFKNRYETTIFSSADGTGVSSGTVSSAFANFDEIGLRLARTNPGLEGANWYWFSPSTLKATSGSSWINFIANDDTNFLSYELRFNFNGTSFSIDVPNTSVGWRLYTVMNNNDRLYTNYNSNYLNIVSKIIGVKYQ